MHKKILPSAAITIGLTVLPVLSIVYFIVTQYSERFVLEQDVSYMDVQGNWLGQLLLEQKWLEWFNRFMDFGFWGLLAAVILIGSWAIANAKTIFKNHYAQESFVNFKESKARWHNHFFIVIFIKLMLVLGVIFLSLSIVGRLMPQLSAQVLAVLAEPTASGMVEVAKVGFTVFLYEYLIAVFIKLFRILRSE